MEDNIWTWTSAKKALSKTVEPGRGVAATDCALRGVWRNSGERFSVRGGRWRLENRGMRVLTRPRSLQPV